MKTQIEQIIQSLWLSFLFCLAVALTGSLGLFIFNYLNKDVI